MNRRARRKAGVQRHKFGAWVRKDPTAPVRRQELAAVIGAAMQHAFREYEARNAPLRQLARGVGYVLGAFVWLARRSTRAAGRVYFRARLRAK